MSRGFKHNMPGETIAQHFLDDRSYLSEKNGETHEILFGLDMGGQREKVFNHRGRVCQVCGQIAPLHDARGEGYDGAWHHVSNKPGDSGATVCTMPNGAAGGSFLVATVDAHPHPELRSIPL